VRHTNNSPPPFEGQDLIITVLAKLEKSLSPQMFEVVQLKMKGYNLREISDIKGWTRAKTKSCSLRLKKGRSKLSFARMKAQAV
jgi:deoxyxylulose-5-phosphate synthase